MIIGLFGKKRGIEKLRGEVQDSFNHVRKDVNKISDWIKHLDGKKEKHAKDIDEIKKNINGIQDEIKELKELISFFGQGASKQTNKQAPSDSNKQTTHLNNQTAVQTTVQTNDLERLTVMERAIVWALINTEMKLSYEDISALLGKDKSTIRGQINTIKQKIPGLLNELKEPNGKKRLFIDEKVKKDVIKRSKIKINS